MPNKDYRWLSTILHDLIEFSMDSPSNTRIYISSGDDVVDDKEYRIVGIDNIGSADSITIKIEEINYD